MKWIYSAILVACLLWAFPLVQTSQADQGMSSGCFEGVCVGLELPQDFIGTYGCKRFSIKRKPDEPRYYPFLQEREKYYGLGCSGSKGKMLGPYTVYVPMSNLFAKPIEIEVFDKKVMNFSASFKYESTMPKEAMCSAIKEKYKSHFYKTVKDKGDNIQNYENACTLPMKKGKGTTGKVYFEVKQPRNKSKVTLEFFDSFWSVTITGIDAIRRCDAEEAKQKTNFIP